MNNPTNNDDQNDAATRPDAEQQQHDAQSAERKNDPWYHLGAGIRLDTREMDKDPTLRPFQELPPIQELPPMRMNIGIPTHFQGFLFGSRNEPFNFSPAKLLDADALRSLFENYRQDVAERTAKLIGATLHTIIVEGQDDLMPMAPQLSARVDGAVDVDASADELADVLIGAFSSLVRRAIAAGELTRSDIGNKPLLLFIQDKRDNA